MQSVFSVNAKEQKNEEEEEEAKSISQQKRNSD